MVAARGRWLTRPSRLAGMGRRSARWILVALATVLLVAALAAPEGATPPEFLHDAIVATLRHGGNFYGAALDLLRTEPDAHAARLLPATLAVVESALPGWIVTALVAAALTLLLWSGGLRLGPLVSRTAGAVMLVGLLGAGVVAVAWLWLSAPHAAAAALLMAIAIVARRPGQALTAAATACAAALIDPAALIGIAAMGAIALLDGDRREQMAWACALAVAGGAAGVHLHALDGATFPSAAITVDGAVGRLVGAAFPDIPAALAAPLLVLSLFGWGTIGDSIGPRIVAVTIAGMALDGFMGMRSATLATALIAPGVALAPGAIGDIVRAASDRRRITVTRMAR